MMTCGRSPAKGRLRCSSCQGAVMTSRGMKPKPNSSGRMRADGESCGDAQQVGADDPGQPVPNAEAAENENRDELREQNDGEVKEELKEGVRHHQSAGVWLSWASVRLWKLAMSLSMGE